MSYNFNEQLEQDSKEYSFGKSRFFTMQEGDNKVRILTPGVAIGQHFMGKGIKPIVCVGVDNHCSHHDEKDSPATPKWVLYLWNYKTKGIQEAKLSYRIMQSLAKLQNNPDYKFDDLPMPYDITINATKAGTTEVQYAIVPSRQNSELPEGCEEQLAKKKPIQEVVDGMRLKSVSQDDIDPDAIPF